MSVWSVRVVVAAVACALWANSSAAQVVSQRGFIEGRGTLFVKDVDAGPYPELVDALAREEVFFRPARWFQVAAGIDMRANSFGQVEDEWRLDWEERGILRPRLAMRRLAATVTAGGFTLDVGKQFVRWGRADIIYPTDRLAPRDYLNVFDSELLPVVGARASMRLGSETFEGVWLPQLTPSRLPLLDQRWVVLNSDVRRQLVDAGAQIPDRAQVGLRWRHTGPRLETALTFFEGQNHQPDLDIRPLEDSTQFGLTRIYPVVRMYGADAAIPTSWLTWKLEAAYVTSRERTTEEYVLYVIEIERQVGEWLLDVGYAGDVTTREHAIPSFNPDRGMARSFVGRMSYTVDPRRTVAFEGALRQKGEGYFAKAEYSQGLGQHWRLTMAGVGIGGDRTDFLGQYRDNTHASLTLRVSF